MLTGIRTETRNVPFNKVKPIVLRKSSPVEKEDMITNAIIATKS